MQCFWGHSNHGQCVGPAGMSTPFSKVLQLSPKPHKIAWLRNKIELILELKIKKNTFIMENFDEVLKIYDSHEHINGLTAFVGIPSFHPFQW